MRDYDERYYEKKLVSGINHLGGLCWKFVSPGHAGVPDRIILLPGGHVLFAEMKAPGKTERPLQRVLQLKMTQLGITVFPSVNTVEKIDAVLARCAEMIQSDKTSKEGGDAV